MPNFKQKKTVAIGVIIAVIVNTQFLSAFVEKLLVIVLLDNVNILKKNTILSKQVFKMNNYTTKDNTKEVLSALDKAIERGLEAIGLTAEGHAKKNETAIDTGRLRNSISHAVEDNAAFIGTNVEYAPYIELGAKGRQGLHFLQRAATEHGAEYKKLLEDSMKNA
jgi:phage gpG-like protein